MLKHDTIHDQWSNMFLVTNQFIFQCPFDMVKRFPSHIKL